MKAPLTLGLIAGLALIAGRAGAAEVFVSVKGSDAAAGSVEAPFATPARALQAVREARKAGQSGAATVWLEDGVYPLTTTLECSGAADADVTFRARHDGAAVLDAALHLQAAQFQRSEDARLPADIDRIVQAIAKARENVGHDGAVMFDAHCAVPPATLIQFAAAVKPYDLLFIEEPAVPGNIEVFKRLKQAINIPLAAGERDRTIWGFIPYLQERCLDILQPDCCHTGGISQMRKIAALAETYMVPLAPHCTASNLGIAASIHAIAATALFLIHEFYPNNRGFNPGIAKIDWQVDKDGYVALPQGTGLCVEMDERTLDEEAKKPQTYKWPSMKLKDGSVPDY